MFIGLIPFPSPSMFESSEKEVAREAPGRQGRLLRDVAVGERAAVLEPRG